MERWEEDFEHIEDVPELENEDVPDQITEKDLHIPDVSWAGDIRKIENPEIRQREIEVAEKILEQQKKLGERLDAGEISWGQYQDMMQFELMPQRSKASMRSILAADNLSNDHFVDVAEDYDLLTAGEPGLEVMDKLDRVEKMIEAKGPGHMQEVADKMLEKKELSQMAHDSISRKIRLSKWTS